MQRNAEDMWTTARKDQTVVMTEAIGAHFHPRNNTQINVPWPRTYSIPDPPFHLNEIVRSP
jgi:hypothetical protein